MSKVIIAVDPGAGGGIAFTNGTKTITVALDHPDVCTYLRSWLEGCDKHNIKIYIEQVGGYIGKDQPGSRMFVFGESFGRVKGWFEMAGIIPRLVQPKAWMHAIAPGVLGIEYEQRKRALKALAQSWYPEINVTLKLGDALCLLEYGKRAESGAFAQAGVKRANTTGDFASDAKAATKWALSMGYPVSKRGTKDFVKMVNYYCANIRS